MASQWIIRVVFVGLCLFLFIALGSSSSLSKIYTFEVVNEYPHDPTAFTQGLLYWGKNTLYESTGLYGNSSVRRVALHTGKVEAINKMDDEYFGEGLTLLDERLYQVTWKMQTGFIYDRNTLSELGTFNHEMNDGWGLATDGKIIFGSDGSSTLYHIDPHTMKTIKKHTIKHKGLDVNNLNELEYLDGEVWANLWQTDCIVRIEAETGAVSGWILLQKLRESLIEWGATGIDVLNGIAWDGDEQRIFVTGKLWPKLYEIKLHLAENQSDAEIEKLCIRDPLGTTTDLPLINNRKFKQTSFVNVATKKVVPMLKYA